MNQLLFYGYALDAKAYSNHAKLMEFKRLDEEINQWQETKDYKELFHSFEFCLMKVRAKEILRQLNIIN